MRKVIVRDTLLWVGKSTGVTQWWDKVKLCVTHQCEPRRLDTPEGSETLWTPEWTEASGHEVKREIGFARAEVCMAYLCDTRGRAVTHVCQETVRCGWAGVWLPVSAACGGIACKNNVYRPECSEEHGEACGPQAEQSVRTRSQDAGLATRWAPSIGTFLSGYFVFVCFRPFTHSLACFTRQKLHIVLISLPITRIVICA